MERQCTVPQRWLLSIRWWMEVLEWGVIVHLPSFFYRPCTFCPSSIKIAPVVSELQDLSEFFFYQKICHLSNIFTKKLAEKKFWSNGKENLSASSPGQVAYTIKTSGCCQKNKLQSGKSLLIFFCEKAYKKSFCLKALQIGELQQLDKPHTQ